MSARSTPPGSIPPLPRDSLFSERILWSGSPSRLRLATVYHLTSVVLGLMAVIYALLALTALQAHHAALTQLTLLSAWAAVFSFLVRFVPNHWTRRSSFVVTDRHVVWRRGELKRTIQREGVSFARIAWDGPNSVVGDLELVRAVPTGALQRTLTLTLQGVEHPDRIWDIIQGVSTIERVLPETQQPVSERLGPGETVVWTGTPTRTWRAWLPLSVRRAATTALGLMCLVATVRAAPVALELPEKLVRAGFALSSPSLLTLLGAVALSNLVVAGVGVWLVGRGTFRKPVNDHSTRYWVTTKRIILQRNTTELHVNRSVVVDVIDQKGLYGGRDVYIVLDGPYSRAFAAHGAFGPGERTRGFSPILQSQHASEVDRIREAVLAPHRLRRAD